MEVGLHLLFGGETLDGLALKRSALVRNLGDHGWRKDEETAIDPPTFAFRLLLEGSDPGSLEAKAAEAGGGMYCSDGDLLAVASCERRWRR